MLNKKIVNCEEHHNIALHTLSCCEHIPFRFLGIRVSIFARTRVMLLVTRHTWAMPSCITTAARSALCDGSHACSERHQRFFNIWIQSALGWILFARQPTDAFERHTVPLFFTECELSVELQVKRVVSAHLKTHVQKYTIVRLISGRSGIEIETQGNVSGSCQNYGTKYIWTNSIFFVCVKWPWHIDFLGYFSLSRAARTPACRSRRLPRVSWGSFELCCSSCFQSPTQSVLSCQRTCIIQKR